ncbi:MAG: hypothetical protein IJR90_00530 [Clostridia bacterium]|nr:hypothetical protein [Clostridia bacterium]
MKNRIAAAWLTAFALLAGSVGCLIAPSSARTLNTDTWSGQVGPYERQGASKVESRLLKSGGQQVLLDMRRDGVVIPVDLTALEACTGRITVTAPQSEWFTVYPLSADVTLEAGESQTVELTVTMIRDSAGPAVTTSAETTVAGAVDVVPEEPDTGPAETTGTADPNRRYVDGGAGGELEEDDDDEEIIGGGDGMIEDDDDIDTPETTAPETTVSETTAPETDPAETEEPEDLTPDRLTFEIAWTDATSSLTASVEMIKEETRNSEFIEEHLLNGVFTDPLGWYSSRYPMLLTLSGAARLKISPEGEIEPQKFPAGTIYEFEGTRTLLYDPGYIDIDSGGNLLIDISGTDYGGTLKLYTDSSNFEIREIDAIEDREGGLPVTAVADETSIGLPYSWGGVTPDFSAEKLVVQQDGSAIWNIAQDITISSDEDGCISLNTAGVPAGTYKINFSWTVNDNTLYATEMIVFVRHG